jgi:hypothetical protein
LHKSLTTYRLKKRATVELPSPAIHITYQDSYIYVSTLQHSHLCFVITENMGKYTFERIFTDSRERNCSAHLVVDMPNHDTSPTKPSNTFVLVNDKKSSSLTGLYKPSARHYKNAAPTLFEACLPRTVVRLQQGDVRPPWRRSATSSTPPPGILTDDILGACSDGTIYTFSILTQPARHLLRFLQNLIEEKAKRDPAKQYSPVKLRTGGIADVLMNGTDGNQEDRIRALDVDPRQRERGFAGPRHRHVDGDLVQRWLEEDGDVQALLERGTEENVARLFGEFARVLWGEDGGGVERVREWLAEVFMPVL